MTNQYMTAEERFWSRVMPEPNSGCWLWNGEAPDGRGRLRVNGRNVRAYRFAYELLVGPIPDNTMVCHRCNIPLCVNPDHLYAGTHADNARDSLAAGTHYSQRYPEKTREIARQLGSKNTWSRGRAFAIKIPVEARQSILDRRAAGESLASIAADFGVTKQGIANTCRRAALTATAKES